MTIEKRAMKRLVATVFVMGLAVCAAAADGRVPIGTVPYTISAPGAYYLTSDLALGTGANLILIAANGVSVDLNGHTLTNTSTSSAVIASTGYTNIEIRNGSILGGNYGIALFTVNGGILSVDHMRVAGYSFSGVSVLGGSPFPEVRITNNLVSTNGLAGYVGIAVDYAVGGLIESNALVGSGTGGTGSGIFLYGVSGLVVADNSVSAYTTGINANSSDNSLKLLRNNASGNSVGISVSTSNYVELQENLASANTTTGISFSSVSGCVYRGNSAQGNPTNYSIPGSGVTNAGGNF